VGAQKRLVFAAFVNIFCTMYSVAGESHENAHEKSNAIQQFQPVADQRSAEPGQAPDPPEGNDLASKRPSPQLPAV